MTNTQNDMEERINQALSQIENDLRDVKSASEQVESVVTSSSQLQRKVDAFVKEVADFSQQMEKISQSFVETREKDVEKFKDSLGMFDQSCDGALSQLKTKLEEVIASFKAEIQNVTETIEGKENDTLKSFNNSINSLNTTCTDAVSSMRNATLELVSEFENKTSFAVGSIKEEVQSLHTEVETIILAKNELVSSVETIKDLREKIEKLMIELKNSQSAQDVELTVINDKITSVSSNSTELNDKTNNVQETLSTINAKIDDNQNESNRKFKWVYFAFGIQTAICLMILFLFILKFVFKLKL